MGEIADAMLSGELCQQCGVFLTSNPPGYPQMCGHCRKQQCQRKRQVRKEGTT